MGIGSVGTRCYIVLMFDDADHPLILQVKEACRSVLEPYAGKSPYDNQGQRIVMGQRLMQSSSDIFLGWVRGRRGFDFFVRQLRDMKMSVPLEGLTAVQLKRYAVFAAGPWPAPMPSPGMPRPSAVIWAKATLLTRPWRNSLSPMRIKMNGITRPW